MSPRARAVGPSNALIAILPAPDRAKVIRSCKEVELSFGEIICEPGAPITHVYFPIAGYISLITPHDVVDSLEVGLVGREGMFGLTVLLDINDSPLLGLVQGSGSALRMSVSSFRKLAHENAAFRRVLNRYFYVLMAQIAQSAACGRFHALDKRLARWLLMTHDRAHSNTFYLTHRFLAYMLGVRRAGVTVAAGRLSQLKLIGYRRGEVQVMDRKGLEALSCPCYELQLKIYREHIATARPSRRASTRGAATVSGDR